MAESAGEHGQGHWLLQGIDPKDAEFLLQNGHEVRFEPGQLVFNEGDKTDGLYLIGRVELLDSGVQVLKVQNHLA